MPVIFWPVLWVYLIRLEATAARCRAEGRKGFMWHLMKTGVIIVSFMDASEAERAARGELPRDFDRTPWTRLAPLDPGALAVLFDWCTLTAPCGRFTAPSRCTVTAPLHPRTLDPP
ncbi:hypothetical protein [Henriciella aquimarina]|uniref:hypothetical protein n=1 Tax=Henriciella aquimarina TaxID=545261 RepID=UPI00117BDACA|nr:hypothetical protein [Henriciella aquimarina]